MATGSFLKDLVSDKKETPFTMFGWLGWSGVQAEPKTKEQVLAEALFSRAELQAITTRFHHLQQKHGEQQ